MTIALTGATGFVGQAVLDQAAQSDETVRALTRRAQAPRANVEWVAGDLSDTAALAALCEPCDAIVHVAGLTNAPDPAAFSARFGFVPLPPGGASSIIHVTDLARLLLALVDAPPALVRRRVFEPDDAREGGWSHKELARAIGKAVGRPVFAPHLPRSVLDAAAKVDRMVRGDKARLTADRVGYMTHPNWVARSAMKVPEAVWSPSVSGEEGLAATARWYRDNGWL